MRRLLLSLVLSGCAASSAELVDSPAGRCVSNLDPLQQCCTGSGLDPGHPSTSTCAGAPLAVIERGGVSQPMSTLLVR